MIPVVENIIPVTVNVDLTNRLSDLDERIYSEMFELVKTIKVLDPAGNQIEPDNSFQIVFTNYTYLIYEFLEMNKSRSIDYDQVRSFGNRFKERLISSFGSYFNKYRLSSWLKNDVEILEMAMYERTTRQNKNIFH